MRTGVTEGFAETTFDRALWLMVNIEFSGGSGLFDNFSFHR
jgi:hypothetical protein